jgi:hypothetical protein
MTALIALAALWGFCEATLFFIVADVPISYIAVRCGRKAALRASVFAAIAAAVGGVVLLFWAGQHGDAVQQIFLMLPAIDPSLIAQTERDFAAGGYVAMALGAFQGVPYKLYVMAAAPTAPGGILIFALASFIARLPRFVLAAVVADAVSHYAGRWCSLCVRLVILSLFWICFYAWYWR